MPIILKNNVDSTLAQAINASETAAIVAAGDGAKFPALGAGDYFYATLVSAQGTREIVKVTSKSIDTLAITRAQEGTTANGFAAGSRVEMRVTAASITDLVDEHDQAAEISIADAGNYYTSTNVEGALQEAAVYNQGGTGAVSRTVRSRLQDSVSVKDFGAVGNGIADDTAAIQAAIDSFASGNGTVFFPQGTYLTTSTLSVTRDRINLIGDGVRVSTIDFRPSSASICIFMGKGGQGNTNAGMIVQCSVRDLSFISNGAAIKKTAIEIKDTDSCIFENIAVGSTTQWTGAGSIGFRVRGRQAGSFRNIYAAADRPFVFAVNTNFPTICLDQFNFHNIYTICAGSLTSPPDYDQSNFFFEPGVNFSNVSFTGYQAWVFGKHGLYYDNSVTAAASSSFAMNIQNVRWEGTFGQNDTGYGFYFDHGSVSTASNISISNCYMGEIGNGYYFRKTDDVTLANNTWLRSSGDMLNIDGAIGEFIQIINCFWQTGGTATIGAPFLAIDAVRSNNTAAVYRSAIYTASQNGGRRDFIAGAPLNQGTIVVAAADPTVVTLPLDDFATVVSILTDSRGKFAIVGFNVVSKVATLIYDDGTWSVTLGTAAKLNVYWDAGSSTWKLQNKTGVSRNLFIQALGSNQ